MKTCASINLCVFQIDVFGRIIADSGISIQSNVGVGINAASLALSGGVASNRAAGHIEGTISTNIHAAAILIGVIAFNGAAVHDNFTAIDIDTAACEPSAAGDFSITSYFQGSFNFDNRVIG